LANEAIARVKANGVAFAGAANDDQSGAAAWLLEPFCSQGRSLLSATHRRPCRLGPASAGREACDDARIENILSTMLQDENVRLPAAAGAILPTGPGRKACKFLK
jgi:hypothetical protein